MLKGNRLRDARKRKKLTQEELGNLVGVGKSAICCYEKKLGIQLWKQLLNLCTY